MVPKNVEPQRAAAQGATRQFQRGNNRAVDQQQAMFSCILMRPTILPLPRFFPTFADRKNAIKMGPYNLGFISDQDIFNHVKQTVELYRTRINLREFNKNIIDPIKLTFDSKVYGQSIEEVIEAECIRQIDKTNTNHIGYFHQNLFRYAGNGWEVPETGFDIINDMSCTSMPNSKTSTTR